MNRFKNKISAVSLQLTEVNSSIWMNVHVDSAKIMKTFNIFQITHSNIRNPDFVQEMFANFNSVKFRWIPRQSIVEPYLSDI
jgi:hypothetical protein